MDDDAVTHRRTKHHQSHDRRSADAVSVLLDLDLGFAELCGEIDELGASPRMEPAFVGDLDLAADSRQAAASPRISLATEIYLRPASRAAATAACTGITLRAPSSRISIGRLTPAMTSTFSLFIRLMARFDGVPCRRPARCRWLQSPPAARRHAPSPRRTPPPAGRESPAPVQSLTQLVLALAVGAAPRPALDRVAWWRGQ